MSILVDILNEDENYTSLKSELKKGNIKNLSTIGLTDSAKAMLVYTLTKELDKPSIIVCSNVYQANKILNDLKFFSTDIEIIFMPSKQINYYDIEAESNEIETQRSYAIQKILEGKRNIVVTTIYSLLVNIKAKKTFDRLDMNLKLSDTVDLNALVDSLNKLGYKRADIVEGKGQFSIRGGIIDIYTTDSELPYRIELFGNEIDSMRTFDVKTQRSIEQTQKINIPYATEEYISNEKRKYIINSLKEFVDRDDINSDLKINILKDIERIENSSLENIFDKYFEFFKDESENLIDYLENYNIFLDEPTRCIGRIQDIIYENEEALKVFSSRNNIYTPFVNRYLSFEEIKPKLEKLNNIYLEKLCVDSKIHEHRKVFNITTKEEYFYRNFSETLLGDIEKNKNSNILFVFPSNVRVEQIKNYLLENGKSVKVIYSITEMEKSLDDIYIMQGILSSGFSLCQSDLVVIAETVSGVKLNKRRKSENEIGSKINNFDELEIGDFLVHENHGIGIYEGIVTLEVDKHLKDYIKIKYANNGNIYVPINQLDLVRKYVCDDDTIPKLNTLGTKEWSITKRKVSEHIMQIAKELVLLYAKRENMQGYAFPKDSPWQREFEDDFGYELTEDQKQSVIEIKEDMEKDKPMDRLLCGDVGYGKTEVAMRAAFKAVMGGKQVAYLVPTTVLSLQQYRLFKERMEKFSIRVEMLSRFKTKKEQTAILKDLIDGKIDIVVGTHRLLSKDVFFKDLGLLIIDEEHRFGVKAKESIKILKETIDVLSMTATPIPRTLNMSMIGIRGMSTLTEPPIERLPIHTFVIEYDTQVIKSAIEKELSRDGQVFYISNKVEDIEQVTAKVREMVPFAKIAYAHGQMEPKKIEDIMLKFINHEIDILVCTTILENGIDIPNANTIIIENADKLGLAQLYQIRGRVGRSSRLAYAYITYKKDKQISELSEKRLRAIRDFTEFGSGFKIALRDLEIRGAGNLLGKEQHRTYGKSWI